MSLLSEVSKTVINATLAFTSASSSTGGASSSSGDGGVPAAVARPYAQVGDPVIIPDLPGNNIYEYGGLGAFDAAITTFVFGVTQAGGAAELQVFANSAAAGSPPAFALAATVPIAGTSNVVGTYATLSDNGLVCAAACFDNNVNEGLFAVFTRPAVTSQAWTQVATVNGVSHALLGADISMSADGSVIAVGQPGPSPFAGNALVYNFNATTGALTLVATLTGTGTVDVAYQGFALAISGDGTTLAVGGLLDNAYTGAVWMFKNTGGTWAQVGEKLVPFNTSPASQIGAAVALSYDGTVLAMTAPQNTLHGDVGSVFMYNLVSGAWMQGQAIYPLGEVNGSVTGAKYQFVKLSNDGNVLMADNPGNQGGQGGVYVYNKQPDGLWVQNGNIRVATGALIPTTSATLYLGGTDRAGSVFAMVNTLSVTVPGGPVAFTVFE